MGVKLIFLLFSLQLWHLSMGIEIPQDLAKSSDFSKCVSSCNKFPLQIGSKLYYIESTVKVNWFQAVNNCRKIGGYLLNIDNSSEMDIMEILLSSGRYWTSSNNLSSNSFLSLTTGKPMPYNRWKEGQPGEKRDKENCVEIVKGVLNVEDCQTLMNYVCQANKL
ncbi:C-type lectin 37Db-like [Drosophila innubila]|uniref:C-type lectin 37Db-like n=1 Tax=Drosophila innubila TaxID=198719 RepID=UPI00148C741F|nr:C-type lectin 37Db-like [Drosophila innubila]